MKPVVLLLVAAALATPASAQQPQRRNPPARPPQTVLQSLARFLGVSTSPALVLRGETTEAVGEVWLATFDSAATRVTTTPEYRSPVFSRDGRGVYVLHGERLELIALPSARVAPLASVPSVMKLVGADAGSDGRLLVVRRNGGAPPRAAVLTAATGDLEPLDDASADPTMMSHLLGQDRSYGSTVLYVGKTRHALFGTSVDRENVFMRRGSDEPATLTRCSDTHCVQPSLSPDGTSFLYVQVAPQ